MIATVQACGGTLRDQDTWLVVVLLARVCVRRPNRYTPSGNVTECGMPLAAWQAQAPGNNDPGTVALVTPDDNTLLALARAALDL